MIDFLHLVKAFNILSISVILSLVIILFFLWRKLSLQSLRLSLMSESIEKFQALEEEHQLLEQKYYEKKTQIEVLSTEIDQLKNHINNLQDEQKEGQSFLKRVQSEKQVIEIQFAELQAQQEEKALAHSEKMLLLQESKTQLKQEFSLLANQILEEKKKIMSEQSKVDIEGMMDPMQKALEGFKQRVELVHKEDLEGRASITEQLKQLSGMSAQMSSEARHLTQALKGDSKLQGNWGELILEKLLESSGLREGVEFEREKSFTTEEGKRYRPDVILNLPGAKHIIIDSKVSLLAYEQAMNAETEAQRKMALKSHLDSLKRHIQALAIKRYDHLEALNPPDFVLMFMPVESAYLMAIEADPSIFENAFDSRVAVVTPTTLFTTLKTIEQLWRYERQSEHTVSLIKRAADVHDKFVGFVSNFEKVGKQLDTVQSTYESARKQMVSGPGNLVRQAEMLKTLAGKTKKDIPAHLLSEAEGEALE